jgi:phosphoglycolate phosphatase
LEGRFDDKADLIAHMLTQAAIDPARAVMVGDRAHDVLAAARNGVAAVGVLWGYGDAQELRDAGAAVLCASPGELAATIAELSAGHAASAFASPRPSC